MKKLSKAHLGKPPWNKGKLGEDSHMFGHKFSDESKQKIGLANSIALLGNTNKRGKRISDKARLKMSIARRGKKFSEETKKRMVESRKRYLARKALS